MKVLTSKEIAEKYVYGKHDALTDNQEIKDMVKDIDNLIEFRLNAGSMKSTKKGLRAAFYAGINTQKEIETESLVKDTKGYWMWDVFEHWYLKNC